jgi:hypothetical protein
MDQQSLKRQYPEQQGEEDNGNELREVKLKMAALEVQTQLNDNFEHIHYS